MEFLISLGYATSDGKPGPNIQPEPTARKRRKIRTNSSGSVDWIASALNNIDAPFAQKVNGTFLYYFPKSRTWSSPRLSTQNSVPSLASRSPNTGSKRPAQASIPDPRTFPTNPSCGTPLGR